MANINRVYHHRSQSSDLAFLPARRSLAETSTTVPETKAAKEYQSQTETRLLRPTCRSTAEPRSDSTPACASSSRTICSSRSAVCCRRCRLSSTTFCKHTIQLENHRSSPRFEWESILSLAARYFDSSFPRTSPSVLLIMQIHHAPADSYPPPLNSSPAFPSHGSNRPHLFSRLNVPGLRGIHRPNPFRLFISAADTRGLK